MLRWPVALPHPLTFQNATERIIIPHPTASGEACQQPRVDLIAICDPLASQKNNLACSYAENLSIPTFLLRHSVIKFGLDL